MQHMEDDYKIIDNNINLIKPTNNDNRNSNCINIIFTEVKQDDNLLENLLNFEDEIHYIN